MHSDGNCFALLHLAAAVACLITVVQAYVLLIMVCTIIASMVGWLQAAAEADAGTASTTTSRKPLLKESNPASQKPDTSEAKRVPSYMKSTRTSSPRSSLGSTPEADARFAF